MRGAEPRKLSAISIDFGTNTGEWNAWKNPGGQMFPLPPRQEICTKIDCIQPRAFSGIIYILGGSLFVFAIIA